MAETMIDHWRIFNNSMYGKWDCSFWDIAVHSLKDVELTGTRFLRNWEGQ